MAGRLLNSIAFLQALVAAFCREPLLSAACGTSWMKYISGITAVSKPHVQELTVAYRDILTMPIAPKADLHKEYLHYDTFLLIRGCSLLLAS